MDKMADGEGHNFSGLKAVAAVIRFFICVYIGFSPHCWFLHRGKDSCNYNFSGTLSTEKDALIIRKTSLDWSVCRPNGMYR